MFPSLEQVQNVKQPLLVPLWPQLNLFFFHQWQIERGARGLAKRISLILWSSKVQTLKHATGPTMIICRPEKNRSQTRIWWETPLWRNWKALPKDPSEYRLFELYWQNPTLLQRSTQMQLRRRIRDFAELAKLEKTLLNLTLEKPRRRRAEDQW